MTTIYIHDGYTIDGYIAASRGLCPDLRFRYRPVLSQDRAVIQAEIEKADPRKQESLAAQVIANRVESWDLQKPKALNSTETESIPLECSEILRIAPAVATTIYNILMGRSVCDEDPRVYEEDRNEATEQELQAAIEGTTPEAHAVKN